MSKIAPRVHHLLRGRAAMGRHSRRDTPLRQELRALLAVARAARDVTAKVEEDFIPAAKWTRLTRALARLARAGRSSQRGGGRP